MCIYLLPSVLPDLTFHICADLDVLCSKVDLIKLVIEGVGMVYM